MIDIVVVNMKHASYDIRIDRRSAYGNRFRVEDYGRDLAIRHYEDWVDVRPWLVERLMHEALAIKKPVVRLGCHCKPMSCHGDVLKRLLMERLR